MPQRALLTGLLLLVSTVLSLSSAPSDTRAQSRDQRLIREASTVTTLAGGGAPGYRDGPAAQVLFNAPRGLAVDAVGFLYVADQYNDRIRTISPDGIVSTFAGPDDGAGPPPAFVFDLQQPVGLGFDADGALYVAEYNRRVWRLPPGGPPTVIVDLTTLPDERPPVRTVLNGFAVARDGTSYLTMFNRRGVWKLTRDGDLSLLAGTTAASSSILSPEQPATFTTFDRPESLAVDHSGNVFVSDGNGPRLLRIALDGTVSGFLQSDGPIATDRHGVLHVIHAGAFNRVGPDGTIEARVLLAAGARLGVVEGLAAGDDAYFISEVTTSRLLRITFDGTVIPLSESFDFPGRAVDGEGDSARFSQIAGPLLALGSDLYILDRDLRAITPEGAVTTVARYGEPPRPLLPDLSLPAAVFDGRIYARSLRVLGNDLLACTIEPAWQCTVARSGPLPRGHIVAVEGDIVHMVDLDFDTNRVYLRRVGPDGVTTLSVGDGTRGRRDGTATEAQFSRLVSRAHPVRDAHGNVYLHDDGSVRRISPDGTVTTLLSVRQAGGADGPLAEAALFGSPGMFALTGALAVMPNDDLLVADDGAIRRISTTGMVTTIAGTPGLRGYRDGAGEVARFDPFSLSIAVTRDGSIWVGDLGNHRIRRIDVHTP